MVVFSSGLGVAFKHFLIFRAALASAFVAERWRYGLGMPRLLVAIKCKCFFSCFRKKVAIDCLLQVPAGGGGGDGFEELEVVLAGEFLTGEMFSCARESLVAGQRFWEKR